MEQQSRSGTSRHITALEVSGLFGHLNYEISTELQGSELDDLLIIYGDNGSGKTTILKLLFNILSSAPGGGRKTYIAQTPFKRFYIGLGNDASISVIKEQLVGSYDLTIVGPLKRSQTFKIKATQDGQVKSEGNQIDKLLFALDHLDLSLYFLPDDRKVQGDFPEEFMDTPRIQRVKSSHLIPRERQLVSAYYDGLISVSAGIAEQSESHHLNIQPVLSRLTETLRRQAIQGSNVGEENAGSIYLRVIEDLKTLSFPSQDTRSSARDLVDRILSISQRVEQFSRFGLHGIFPSESLMEALKDANARDRATILVVLEPYLEGLEGRLSALQELYDIVSTYVDTMNSFLSNKIISFDTQSGILVTSKWGDLIDPNMLSSGERQLLLLLSNILLARKQSSIFIIDEPELSLNVKWQRQLVSALLRCSRGGGIQYILASHSIELISQYRGSTTRLNSRSYT